MRRWIVVFAVGAIVLALVGWRMLRALDENAPVVAHDAAVAVVTADAVPDVHEIKQPPPPIGKAAEEKVTARGTLRVTIEAPGRLGSDEMTLLYRSGEQKSVRVGADRIVTLEVEPGTYFLRIVATVLDPLEVSVEVRANETTNHVIRVSPPTVGLLRVFAIGPDGRGLGGTRLQIVGRDIDESILTLIDGTTARFVPGGTYDVSTPTASVRVHVVNGGTHDVRVAAAPAAVLRGVVVDTTGAPVTAATVSLVVYGHSPSPVDGVALDARGAFRIPVAGEGPYYLVAKRGGGGESPITLVDGATPARLVIDGGATLSGTVVDADGKPVPSFSIDVSAPGGRSDREFHDGAFEWPNLGSGEYQVSASVGNRWAIKFITIAPDARTARSAFTLPRAYAIRGRLIDSVSREPVAGVRMSVSKASMSTVTMNDGGEEVGIREWMSNPHSTDAQGRFAIDDLVDGALTLVIEPSAGYLGANQNFTIAGATLDLGDILLARARR